MKKSLIALAALATVASAAQAQSSVTVYGLLDAGVRVDTNAGYISSAGAATDTGKSKVSFGDGVLSTNRFGLKGTEDLGGGLKANFQLEGGFYAGSGASSQSSTSLFDRFSWVGLSGDFGAVELGRNWNAQVYNAGIVNAHGLEFEGNGTTANTGYSLRANQVLSIAGNTTWLGTTRSDSMIAYKKSVGDTNLIATYSMGGVAGNTTQKSGQSVGLNTKISGVQLAAAYLTISDATNDKLQLTQFGGNAEVATGLKVFAGFHYLKVAAGYTRDNLSTQKAWSTSVGLYNWGTTYATRASVYNVGASYAWTPTQTSALSYFDGDYEQVGGTKTGKYKSFTFTHKYALSKRTTAYLSLDQGKANADMCTAPCQSNVGYGVGLLHAF